MTESWFCIAWREQAIILLFGKDSTTMTAIWLLKSKPEEVLQEVLQEVLEVKLLESPAATSCLCFSYPWNPLLSNFVEVTNVANYNSH